MSRLRLAIHQFPPRLRDVPANAAAIAAAAERARADLLLTPELALTGYDVGDDAAQLALALQPDAPPELAGLGDASIVLGLIERGEGGLPYNAAVHLAGGRVRFRHRKVYLPTYGMFDEARFFGRGGTVRAFELGSGWRAGLLVCEDFWHPALAYLLAAQGIELLLVLAAAPGRGVWQGGERGGRFASWDAWERIARTTAQLYGIYVALANRTGVEGGVSFAGGSLVAGPDGGLVAEAAAEEEALLVVDLSLEETARARRPYAHRRDEDMELLRRELARLAGARHA